MKVMVNGEERDVPDNLSVAGLLGHLGLKSDRIAIERNLEILPRARWQDAAVQAGDRYEIVQFVGGG